MDKFKKLSDIIFLITNERSDFMKNSLDVCMDIIRNMLIEDKPVNFASPNYVKFKELITKYVYERNLDNTLEWNIISELMIYTSNQTLSGAAANNILINLEKLKRLDLKQKQEEVIFDNQIHSLISKVCKKKYFDGHYADAVESAFKEVNSRCKNIFKTIKGEEKDGSDLMNNLFSPNNPILSFEDNSTESGKNVQLGYMQIFSGSIIGIRNPKAHENQILNKEGAYKRLVLASLLMDKLDEAEAYEKSKVVVS